MSNFVHLHVHTDYSLLDGAARIEDLVSRAKALGQSALAITDHGNMFGALRFQDACKKEGIKAIIGSEFYVAGGARTERSGTEQGNKYYHLILLAKNKTGYRNLMKLSSFSWTEGFYYKPRIDEELLRLYHEGVICLTACVAGELPQILLHASGAGSDAENAAREKAQRFIDRYTAIFGKDDFFIEVQNHGLEEERTVARTLMELAAKNGLRSVVTNDVHYTDKDDWDAQEVLECIGMRRLRKDYTAGPFRYHEYYLKSAEEMERLFPGCGDLLANTAAVAAACDNEVIPSYDVGELKDCLPVYDIPPGFSGNPTMGAEEAYIRHLVSTGLKKRYAPNGGEVAAEVTDRAEFELKTITAMGFVGYFLIVWDFINWAKEQDIPIGPGRGSGAGSIVAFAMGITNIDPLRFKLFFERFLNPDRISMPDFDIDISNEGRQAVIEYTRRKYGEAQVGNIATFGTLQAKNVIKDVGRVMDIPLSEVNALTKKIPPIPHFRLAWAFDPDAKDKSGSPISGAGQLSEERNDTRYKDLFDMCLRLEGMIRGIGLHASGIVIGKTALPDWVPVFTFLDKDNKDFKDTREEKRLTGTQFVMTEVEGCGLVKMDYLGLKTLDIIQRAERMIRKRPGFENFAVETIDQHDEATFDVFCRGDTASLFQFESAGMQKTLRQAKPRRIEDLIALNALYRPGPMAYIDKFIEGRFYPEKITYPDPCLKDILEETYGVIVYQEQVMQVAQRIAGYSLGGADLLRRAMGKKKVDVMVKEKECFIAGAVKNGFKESDADRIFEILIPFAGYGFNKSHAAAYSVLAYQTAYLKAHFQLEFFAASLTNQIFGTNDEKLPAYIEEGRSMGLVIDPPDINSSEAFFAVTPEGHISFGLMAIKGLGSTAAELIVDLRVKDGPYKNFMDFLDRVNCNTAAKNLVNKKALEVLIKTGCFDPLGQARSELFHNMEKAVEYSIHKRDERSSGVQSLFGDTGEKEFADFVFEAVDEWPLLEKLVQEKLYVGCYISGHPLDEWRSKIKRVSTLTSDTIASASRETAFAPNVDSKKARWQTKQSKKQYTVAGWVKNLSERFTKKGDKMAIADLDDLGGTIRLLFFPKTWEKLRGEVANDHVAAFSGTLEDATDSQEGRSPTFFVDSLVDLEKEAEKETRELHIVLSPCFSGEADLLPLRDALYAADGKATVIFHFPLEQEKRFVRANPLIHVTPSTDFLEQLQNQCPQIETMWTE